MHVTKGRKNTAASEESITAERFCKAHKNERKQRREEKAKEKRRE